LLLGAGGLQFALVCWWLSAFHFGFPQGRWIQQEVHQLNLFQTWKMFAQRDPPLNSWWTGAGVLANGERVSVLEAIAPKIISAEIPEPHWEAIRGQMMASTARKERALFGRYLCRTFNRSAPIPLRAVELTLHEQAAHDPSEPPARVRVGVIYRLPCDEPVDSLSRESDGPASAP
jgi:hypothetical protein